MASRYVFLIGIVLPLVIFYCSDGQVIDGGASGDNNSTFVNGTNNTEKLVAGNECSRNSSDDPNLMVRLVVKENDPNFVHETGPNAGELITYFCQLLNVTAFRNGIKERQNGEGCNLTRVDNEGNITADDVDERTLTTTFTFDSKAGQDAVPCGGLQVGSIFYWVAECNRNYPFTNSFDVIFEYSCDNTTAFSRRVDTNTGVGGPPVQNVTRGYNTTANAYTFKKSEASGSRFATEKSVEGNGVSALTGVINLGTSFYFEFCIKTANPYRFFEKFVDPMGIWLGPISVYNDQDYNQVQDGFISEQLVTDRFGCSQSLSPALHLGNTVQSSFYVQPDGANETKFYLLGYNCFRTREIQAEAFLTKNVGTSRQRWEFTLNYCTSTELDSNGVNACFGDITTFDDRYDGYRNCSVSGAAGRRRRQASEELARKFDLPETLSFDIFVNTNVEEEVTQPTAPQEGCFEKDTFTILTACLSFLLAVVLMVAVFLACRLQAVQRDEKENSLSGFSNKGYY